MYSHHFSINNIPFGIASSSSHAHKSIATRLEDTVIFLDELAKHYPELSKEILTTFSKVSNNSLEAFFMTMAKLVRKHSTPSPLSLKLSIDGQGNGSNHTLTISLPSHSLPALHHRKAQFTYHSQSETSQISPALANTS
jgi:hypothetical protein